MTLTPWREAKACQSWVCQVCSEEGEVQAEDPGICQLQTSLSSLSARRTEELTVPPSVPPVPLPTLEAGARQVKTFPTGPPMTSHSRFPEYPQALPRHPILASHAALGTSGETD